MPPAKTTDTNTNTRVTLRIPLAIRSSEKLGRVFEQTIKRQLATRLAHASELAQRATIRFEDVNGPKGGVDKICRLKITLRGIPPIVVEKQAATHDVAFARAIGPAGTAIDKALKKHRPTGTRTGRTRTIRDTSTLREPPAKPARRRTTRTARG